MPSLTISSPSTPTSPSKENNSKITNFYSQRISPFNSPLHSPSRASTNNNSRFSRNRTSNSPSARASSRSRVKVSLASRLLNSIDLTTSTTDGGQVEGQYNNKEGNTEIDDDQEPGLRTIVKKRPTRTTRGKSANL